jgi:hypothetical protein
MKEKIFRHLCFLETRRKLLLAHFSLIITPKRKQKKFFRKYGNNNHLKNPGFVEGIGNAHGSESKNRSRDRPFMS